MKPPTPYVVLSRPARPVPGRGCTGLYSLLAMATGTGRRFYFVCAYRRSGRREELEVSPVVASHLDQAVAVFHLLAGIGQVSPVHLPGVVHDLRQAGSPLPLGEAGSRIRGAPRTLMTS